MQWLSLLFLSPLLAGATPAWRPFSADSPWNEPIPAAAPLDRASASLIDDLASRGAWHINIRDWSIPVYFVDADATPRQNVGDSRPGIYGRGFAAPRRIPIPDGAVASPPVGAHSDNHLCVVDRAKGLAWDMWAARQDEDGRWFTGLGAVTDLTGSGVAPPWYDSPREFDSHRARASGFPLVAGLIMLDDIKSGQIDHALAFAYDHCRTGLFVPPASTAQADQLDAVNSRGIPMGGRIQLDPAWDVDGSGLSPVGKIIARALQKYGAYCSDYAGANVFYAENSPSAVQAWSGLLDSRDLATVFTADFIRDHFRVLDMGNLLPGQNLKVRPPYVLAFSLEGETSPAHIDQLTRTITVYPAALPAKAVWRLHPRKSALRLHETAKHVDSGLLNATDHTLLLSGPYGSSSVWQLVRGN